MKLPTDGRVRPVRDELAQRMTHQQVEWCVGSEFLLDGMDAMRLAQAQWAARPIVARLATTKRLRRMAAAQARELAESIPTELAGALSRTVADSLVAEVLPLIEAARFLEREAAHILRPRLMDGQGAPAWLPGIKTEVERAPWGTVLILGAANYPLLLAGVQTLQALVAGNAVLWKPAPGTEAPALAFRRMLIECGLPAELLTILDPEIETATSAIAAGVDHVVLTGSAETGRAVLHQLAETLTPATMELSGCDAVFILPGADLGHAVEALAFGLRFNGSFTCMAPRRVFAVGLGDNEAAEFELRLMRALAALPPVAVPMKTLHLLEALCDDAREQGAEVRVNGEPVHTNGESAAVRATLITRANPALLAMRTDVFAPILSVMRTADAGEALAAAAACPYALTASIFGPIAEARSLAAQVRAGNILINDVIVPTADPRVAFGGRGHSGFGVTRGAEGLLAMTTPRTIQTQTRSFNRLRRNYQPTGVGHADFFAGLAAVLHAGRWRDRMRGLSQLLGAARTLK